jgi:hypothetical protein
LLLAINIQKTASFFVYFSLKIPQVRDFPYLYFYIIA